MISVYIVCWEEEVRLPFVLRHYAEFADRIVVYDNFSADRSREIVEACPIAEYRTYGTRGVFSDLANQAVKNECWKAHRDGWAIVGDLDELVYHPSLPDFLHQSEAAGVTIWQPVGWTMVSRDVPTGSGQLRDWCRRGHRDRMADKLLVFRPGQVDEIGYHVGAHNASPTGQVNVQWDHRLKTLHYHFLSPEFLVDRYRKSAARMSDENRRNGWGVHYLQKETEIRAEWQRRWDASSEMDIS